MAHSFEIGTGAWQPDATEGWVASEVQQKVVTGDKVKLVFKLANGSVRRKGSGRIPLKRLQVC
jgi:myosin-5